MAKMKKKIETNEETTCIGDKSFPFKNLKFSVYVCGMWMYGWCGEGIGQLHGVSSLLQSLCKL